MALRNIVEKGNEILAKKCKPVKEITPRIQDTCMDMIETMLDADGVGLAAPQIGIMKRFFVAMPHIDSDDEELQETVYCMINPEITHMEGHQDSSEGCLSVPGYMGLVDRPERIKMKAQDLNGEWMEYEFEGFAATVMCHEYDHLDGILYCDKATDFMTTEEYTKRLNEVKAAHADEAEGAAAGAGAQAE